jgi:hypothetical protein
MDGHANQWGARQPVDFTRIGGRLPLEAMIRGSSAVELPFQSVSLKRIGAGLLQQGLPLTNEGDSGKDDP